MQGGVHVHSPFLPDHHCDQHRDRREQPERSVEAAQIIVGAQSAALTGVNLTASDLSDGFGHT